LIFDHFDFGQGFFHLRTFTKLSKNPNSLKIKNIHIGDASFSPQTLEEVQIIGQAIHQDEY